MAFLFAIVHSTIASNGQGKSLGDSPYELGENFVCQERQSLCTLAGLCHLIMTLSVW